LERKERVKKKKKGREKNRVVGEKGESKEEKEKGRDLPHCYKTLFVRNLRSFVIS
jgi:hypothetical protein